MYELIIINISYATNGNTHVQMQQLWGSIRRRTVERNESGGDGLEDRAGVRPPVLCPKINVIWRRARIVPSTRKERRGWRQKVWCHTPWGPCSSCSLSYYIRLFRGLSFTFWVFKNVTILHGRLAASMLSLVGKLLGFNPDRMRDRHRRC